MEHVVSLLQLVDARRKQIGIPVAIWKEFKACVDAILKTTTISMMPSACFECISKLLGSADISVRKKVDDYSSTLFYAGILYHVVLLFPIDLAIRIFGVKISIIMRFKFVLHLIL